MGFLISSNSAKYQQKNALTKVKKVFIRKVSNSHRLKNYNEYNMKSAWENLHREPDEVTTRSP